MESTTSTTAKTASTATASNSNPATQNRTDVKLVFRKGEKGDFISKYESKIAIIDRAIKDAPSIGVSYTCELKPMMKGNGWIVTNLSKTPPVQTNLTFKKGKKMYNEKTNTYKENMVSSFDGEIVIAPENMVLEAHKEYDCEIVLSPSGRAYIVQTAVTAKPAVAEIIAHEYPVSCVEVKIGGVIQEELSFECADGDARDIQWKKMKLGNRSIVDKDMVLSNFEATCEELLGKFKSKGYDRNKSNLH